MLHDRGGTVKFTCLKFVTTHKIVYTKKNNLQTTLPDNKLLIKFVKTFVYRLKTQILT